jgi:acetyl-CoA C-acetyltransferase
MEREVVVLGAMRSAIGTFGGTLRDVSLTRLATVAVKAALERSGVPTGKIGHVVMGNVVPTEPNDAYLSRVAAIDAGLPIETPAFNVNRLSGSGLQAIISAAQSVMLSDTDFAVAGGAESMSRGPYLATGARWGARLGDTGLVDYMNGILHDPWRKFHMGLTAENVAKLHGIDRRSQDELAEESQRRASRAIAEGRFVDQIVPVEVTSRKKAIEFKVDEHVRSGVTVEALAAMPPVFQRDGTVTAGNSSGVNDGAAAVILSNSKKFRGAWIKAPCALGWIFPCRS